MTFWLDSQAPNFTAEFDALLNAKRETSEEVDAVVRDIIQQVRSQGDAAVIALTQRFDRLALTPESLRLDAQQIAERAASVAPATYEALELAAARIRAYHEKQVPQNQDYRDELGVRLGARWLPVEAAGLYVPGGTAAYPSSVLMNAIPAKVAGVDRLVMCVPAPDGALNPAVLAAAKIAGVDEVLTIGGAQAIAAMAYGTQSIQPVDVIVGPGNAYVAAAKRLVYGQVGIDMIAGPSEILVIADSSANPSWIAADLLSQAEHDRSSQSILVSPDAALLRQTADEVERQLESLPRSNIARDSWRDFGALIQVRDLAEAARLSNRLAPEHLELAILDPDALLPAIRNAGSVFMGHFTPEPIGDYMAGPNHVLPTARSARYASGLNVFTFLKRSSFLALTPESLQALAGPTATLAREEGLEAHARAVEQRLNR
jgi:histidinol dehydrogenase